MPKYITKQAHKRWKDRVEEIGKELLVVYNEIGEAARLGDLRENSEYQFSVEKRDRLMHERNTLQKKLNELRGYIEDMETESGKVGIGCYVKFVRDSDGKEFEYVILGTSEDDNPRPNLTVVVYEAPIATQLLGKHVGDVFVMTLPAWKSEVEILASEPLFSNSRASE